MAITLGKSCTRIVAYAAGSLLAIACVSCSSEPVKMEKIPLDSIYTTSTQEGLRRVTFPKGDPNHEHWLAYVKFRPEASSIFLVRGNLTAAIKGTLRTFSGRREGRWWVAAFFGFGSEEPVTWTIVSVEQGGGKIRINYRELEADKKGKKENSLPYFVWVPLEDLEAPSYILELADAGTGMVSFMRFVELQY